MEQSSLEEICRACCVLPPPDAQLCLVPLREAARTRAVPATWPSSPPAPPPPPSAPGAAQSSHGQGVLRARRRRDAPGGGALPRRLGLGGSASRSSTFLENVARDALGGARDAFQDPPPQDAPAFSGDRRRARGVPGRLRAQALRAFRARAIAETPETDIFCSPQRASAPPAAALESSPSSWTRVKVARARPGPGPGPGSPPAWRGARPRRPRLPCLPRRRRGPRRAAARARARAQRAAARTRRLSSRSPARPRRPAPPAFPASLTRRRSPKALPRGSGSTRRRTRRPRGRFVPAR